MMDADKIQALMDALHNLFGHTASQSEKGQGLEGKPASKPDNGSKGANLTIVSVGKAPKRGTAIPKLPMKKDTVNDGPLGSGKKGSKGE